MSFPEYATSVTVPFTTNLNLGSDWIICKGAGTWADAANRFQSIAATAVEEATAYTLSTLTGALKEATVVLPAVTGSATWIGVGLLTTGTVGTSFNGYGFFVKANDGQLAMSKYAAGVESVLLSAGAGTFIPVAGDAIGISFDGTTVTGYTRHSGVWTLRLTTNPASPYSGNMYAFLDVVLDNELDDLSIGSGALVGVAAGSPPMFRGS